MSGRSRGPPTKSRCILCTGKNRRCNACRFGTPSNSSSSSSSSSTSSSFDKITGWRSAPPASSARSKGDRKIPAVGRGSYTRQKNKADDKVKKAKEKKKSLKRARPPPNDVKEFLEHNGVKPSNIPNAHSRFKRVPIAGETGQRRTGDYKAVLTAGVKVVIKAAIGHSPTKQETQNTLNILSNNKSSSSSSSSSASSSSSSSSSTSYSSSIYNTKLSHNEKFVKKKFEQKLSYRDKKRYLSMIMENNTNVSLNAKLDVTINSHLYQAAGIHAKYPGPGVVDDMEPSHRQQISPAKFDKFVEILFNSTMNDAFSNSIYVTCKGDIKEVPNLLRTNQLDDIFHTYIQQCINEMTAEQIPVERCQQQCFRTKTQCLHSVHGDEMNHKYTPPNAISLTTAKKIMSVLSPKQIISLAGLDDIATTYGYENFLQIHANLDALKGKPLMDAETFAACDAAVTEAESFCKKEFIAMIMLDSECLSTCIRGGCTNPPELVAIEEDQIEEEIVVAAAAAAVAPPTLPTNAEGNPELFTGTEEGDGTTDCLGFVFQDTTESIKDGMFVFVGVDTDDMCLYRKINRSGISKGVPESSAFDTDSTGYEVGDRTIKDLFFGNDGNGIDYVFLGKGKKGVSEARKRITVAHAAIDNIGGLDLPVNDDMGAPGALEAPEIELDPIESLTKSQLKEYLKLHFKRTKKISHLDKDGLRDLIVGL